MRYDLWKHKIESPFPSRKEILVYQFDAWQLKVVADYSMRESVWRKSVYFGNAEGVHIVAINGWYGANRLGEKIKLAAKILTEWDPSTESDEIEVWWYD